MKYWSAIATTAIAVASASCGPLPGSAGEKISKAEEEVKRLLTDPNSAQFRDTSVRFSKQKGEVVCGEVNSKNQMGGYVGFEPFYVGGAGARLKPEPGAYNSGSFYDEYIVACLQSEPAKP